MQHPILALALLLLAPVVAFAVYAESKYPVPSYREAREAFKTNMAKAGGPKFRPEDRRIMDDAARDLAATMPDPGLPVGAKAPDFVLPNAFGKTRRLTDLISDGPVVLVFYRGAWCPYCNLQLRGLRETLPYIEQEGAQLVAITPQTPDKSREQVQKDGYPFEILSDLDDRVMKEYRLFFEVPSDLSEVYEQRLSLDLAEYNGEGRYVLPVPATFVIDRSGTIRAAYADVDYRNRVEPTTIIAALRALAPTNARQP